MAAATPTVQADNDRVTVTHWSFAADGDATGWYRHGHDFVVVPLMDGRLKAVSAAGETVAELKAGVSYFRPEGVEHDIVNVSGGPFAFIEVEIKR